MPENNPAGDNDWTRTPKVGSDFDSMYFEDIEVGDSEESAVDVAISDENEQGKPVQQPLDLFPTNHFQLLPLKHLFPLLLLEVPKLAT